MENLEVNKYEVARYMRVNREGVTDELLKKIDDASCELKKHIHPKSIYRIFSLKCENENEFTFAGIHVKSDSLKKNLESCEKICMMAITLGTECDRMIKRAALTGMDQQLLFQATAAGLAEAYCNVVNEAIQDDVSKDGYKTKPRFSPGYGDFDISYQEQFLKDIDAGTKLGIKLTTGNLMIPSKSITAVIGLYKD